MVEQHPQQSDQLLEFLRRGEVRTMAKDVARLRKEEAEKERQHIEGLGIQANPMAPEKFPLASLSASQIPQAKETAVIVVPKSQGAGFKILVRVFAALIGLFLVLNATAFLYWLATRNKAQPTQTKPMQTQTQAQPPAVKKPAPQVPESLFGVASTKIISLAQPKETGSQFLQVLADDQVPGFTRIVFLLPQNKILGSHEFLDAMNMALPQNLSLAPQNNLMLFVYTSEQNKRRPGFVVNLAQGKGTAESIKAAEATLEQNLSPFFSPIGPKDRLAVSFFRQIVYKKNAVRCQTFSSQDLGICYDLIGNNLIFTSSLESMKAIINQLSI